MADYASTAALRQALTSDNPDERVEAYSTVLEADVQPTDVLETPPDEQAVQKLIEVGALPPEPDRTPVPERLDRIEDVLTEIRDKL